MADNAGNLEKSTVYVFRIRKIFRESALGTIALGIGMLGLDRRIVYAVGRVVKLLRSSFPYYALQIGKVSSGKLTYCPEPVG